MARSNLYQRIKNIIHAVQALIIFIGGAITGAILTKGPSDGRLTYYLVLCGTSLVLLIYQTAFPVLKFTKRLANAYVHGVIDLAFVILWLAACLAEIGWTRDGTRASKSFKDGDPICKVFEWGSTNRCELGRVIMIVGAITCGLFALTSAFSIYGISFYRSHGCLPGQDKDNKGKLESLIAAGERSDQILPSHPLPQDVEAAQPEMTTVEGENMVAATQRPRERSNVQGRPTDWPLPHGDEDRASSTLLPIVRPAPPHRHAVRQSPTRESQPSPYVTDLRHQNSYSKYIPSNPFTNDDGEDLEPPSPMSQSDYHSHYRPYQHQSSESYNLSIPRIQIDPTFGAQSHRYNNTNRYSFEPVAQFPPGEYGR